MTEQVQVARNLAQLSIGESAFISNLTCDAAQLRRLNELGLNVGEKVQIIRRAPLGDPLEISVRGYQLSLRGHEAKHIQLTPEKTTQDNTEDTRSAGRGVNSSLPEDRATRVSLIGNPNCGKTALFNAMTGLRQRVANYPGVTVDKKIGSFQLPNGSEARIIDLPGTYSLIPNSPDESVAVDVLLGLRSDTEIPDRIIIVVDANNLARNLVFACSILELGLPAVIALTMNDVAASNNKAVDAKKLADIIGVDVIDVHPPSGRGILELGKALEQAVLPTDFPWRISSTEQASLNKLAEALGEKVFTQHTLNANRCIAQRLMVDDALLSDPRLQANEGPRALIQEIKREQKPIDFDVLERFHWVDQQLEHVTGEKTAERSLVHDSGIDKILLHPILGLGIFAGVMWALFAAIFIVADPMMGWAEEIVAIVGESIASVLPDNLIRELWLDGIVAGVGGVLVFVPQIAVLFFLLALLDECGYLARGAFLLDRILSVVGLHGKSFVPLLSSHACAIPGIMAARSIEHPRERLATMLVAPFMACGARLPVYALLITTFFGHESGFIQGSILWGLYILGIATAYVSAWILRSSVLKGGRSGFFIELHPYHIPNFGQVWRAISSNVMHFIKKAGTIILAFSIVIWAALRFPEMDEAAQQNVAQEFSITLEQIAEIEDETIAKNISEDDLAIREAANLALVAAQTEQSVAGRIGKAIEPLIAPMGCDWQIGIGLLGSFAAREVFVSTMGIVYGLGDEVDEESEDLMERMLASTHADGTAVWSPLLAIVLLVWFAIAMQCISTVAVMRRETKGWRWPIAQLVGMNVMAWVLCVAIWQIGSLFLT